MTLLVLFVLNSFYHVYAQVDWCPKLCAWCPCVQGSHIIKGANGSAYEAFYGIPYAQKPIKNLRFQNPKETNAFPTLLTGEKPKCIQREVNLWRLQISGSEDCLYLNIYRPNKPKGRPMSVFVYFPHSDLLYGSGQPTDVIPDWIVDAKNKKSIIFIVVQYRVGLMGFFSTGDRSAPGNLGLKDQQLALQWIQRNIPSFSGAANDITVFGDATVQYQLMRPKINFQKAVITGSYAFTYFKGVGAITSTEAAQHAKQLGLVLDYGEMTSKELVLRLQNEKIDRLMEVQGMAHSGFFYPFHIFGPMVETNIEPEVIPGFRSIPLYERFFLNRPTVLWSHMDHNVSILMGYGYFYGEAMAKAVQNFTSYTLQMSTQEALKLHLNLDTDIAANNVLAHYGLQDKWVFEITMDEWDKYVQVFTDRFYNQALRKTITLYNNVHSKDNKWQLFLFVVNSHTATNNVEAKHLFSSVTYKYKYSQAFVKMIVNFMKTGRGPNEPCVISKDHSSGALCPYVELKKAKGADDDRLVDESVFDVDAATFWDKLSKFMSQK